VRGDSAGRKVELLASIALAAGLTAFAPAAPSATGQDQAAAAAVVVVKLTESQSTMTPSRVPVGPVVFRIVNRGKTARSFAIGRAGAASIAPGSSVSLRAVFSERGPHQYVSFGRHVARLSGVLTTFVPCSHPQASTVRVRMDHDRSGITLSQTTIPCGTVTFVVTNIGVLVDSFQVFTDYPHARGTTPELQPGETARLTIRFTEKSIAYYQSGDYIPGEPEFGGGDADGGSFKVG
jgi:hypothetical protein